LLAGLESLDALKKLSSLSLEVKHHALKAVQLLLVILGNLLRSDLISLLFREAIVIHDGIYEVVDVNVIIGT
jgi:hypothetical protein